jgi:hypothetical protein
LQRLKSPMREIFGARQFSSFQHDRRNADNSRDPMSVSGGPQDEVSEYRHLVSSLGRDLRRTNDMQQPPLSRLIRLMERELKAQLFRRLPRGVELTSAGHALLPEAKAMLARLDHALESTRRAARGEQGSLCVGIAPTAPFNPLVPRAIRAFREPW